MAEKRTPMAWQHRDLNYHQGGYQDRYGPGLDMHVPRPGPPSTSDRLSHRTDKSWRTRESHAPSTSAYHGPVQGSYIPHVPYSSDRPISRQQTPGSTTGTSSSSTSDEDSEEEIRRNARGASVPQAAYGYSGYYPGYLQNGVAPNYPPSATPGYPGTIKSAKSVPAMTMGTWDGEPCPVHGMGMGPMSLPMDHPAMNPMGPPMPPMMPVGPASMPPVPMAPRRAASIYDMRMINTPPAAIYGTLPGRPPMMAGDRRSLAGMPSHGPPQGIPPHLLPPMVRPRPLVVSEDGTAEPLPVRSPPEKNGTLSGLAAKMAEDDPMKKKKLCARGGSCVAWVIIGIVTTGILIGLLVVFIL